MLHKLTPHRIFAVLGLSGICVVGDVLVYLNSHSKLLKAICDNATHALIGLVTSVIIISELDRRIATIEKTALVLTGFWVSSLIDIDHFVEAKSWKLHHATSLKRRPFLHCTTIPLVALLLLLFVQYNLRSFRLSLWLSIVISAFLSHHARDATRRGFWIYPFGHTPPLSYVAYIISVDVIPFAFTCLLNNAFKDGHKRLTPIDVNNV